MRARLPLLLTGAALLEFWLELALLTPADAPYRGLVFVLMAVVAGALYAGRRHPLESVLVVFGVMALLPALSQVYYEELVLPFAAPFFAAYQLGMYAPRRTMFIGLLATTPLSLAATMPNDQSAQLTSGLFSTFVGLFAPVMVARLLRNRLALNRALREKAAQLEHRRADAAGRAVLDERTRIAGELHDVVAHALSAMTVQATGARRLTLRRPELALDAFAAIETAGREALDELRRLLGVLRRDDAELTLTPQPSLRHIRSLTRRVSASGLPVTLRVEDERELPAGIDLTAYRVIGDALTAAREHGGAGRAEVRLRYRSDALELEVRDDGRSPTQRELIGIRERVLLHGGRLTTGTRRGGGYVVRATLPLDGQPVAEPTEPPCAAEAALRRVTRPTRSLFARRASGANGGAPHGGANGGAPHGGANGGAPHGGANGGAPHGGGANGGAPRGGRSPRVRLARWLRRPAVVDALVAAVAVVAGMIEVAVAADREGPLAANLLVAAAYAAPLAWRRRAPLAALAVAVTAVLTMALALTSVVSLFVPFVAILALAYAAAAHRDGREAYAALVLVVAALPVIVTTMPDRILGDFLFPTAIGVFAWVAGRVVRGRTRLTVELHEATARLAEANEEERRLAAVDERRRIAREMHDLVAHSISVMVVQAGGARRILDRDPTRALEAAARIERTGREALTEMRHLLGMLADGAEPPALAPQPTLGEIGELITRARLAGLPTTLDVRGEPRPLPAGLDLAAYRIVQEALTNAIKHAPGADTTVTVNWSDALALEIHDTGQGSAGGHGGHGLVGMRERVRLYGGAFEAGPTGTGWRVRATLPTDVRELSLV